MELNSILNSAFIKPLFNKLKNTMVEKNIPAFIVKVHVVDGELKIDVLEQGTVAVSEADLQMIAGKLEHYETLLKTPPGFPPSDMPEQAILNPEKPL